jgi:hypothetical protein
MADRMSEEMRAGAARSSDRLRFVEPVDILPQPAGMPTRLVSGRRQLAG